MQRLANLVIDNAIKPPRPLPEIKADLRAASKQLRGMRTVISMIQQGHDMSALLGDVLKTIDTSNYELKLLCNFYLMIVCINRPACLLMCTHVFFKDFNDQNAKIQQLAVVDSVELSDEVLVKNYIQDIRRMCKHRKAQIRVATARCLLEIHRKNAELFHSEQLEKQARMLLEDEHEDVQQAALRAFAGTSIGEGVITVDWLIETAKRHMMDGDTAGLRIVLGALRNRKMSPELARLLEKTVKSCDICVFYTSAAKLLEAGGKDYASEIYQAALGFMNVRLEQRLNLLRFIVSFCDRITVNIDDIAIILSDSAELKAQKMEIMIKKYRDFDEDTKATVLQRMQALLESDSSLARPMLRSLLSHDVFVADIVKSIFDLDGQIDQALGVIMEMRGQLHDGGWVAAISGLVDGIEETAVPDTLIDVASDFCTRVPPAIHKLKSMELGREMCMKLVQYYVRMLHSGVIGQSACVNGLKMIQERHEHNRRIQIVLEHLDKVDPEDIVYKQPEKPGECGRKRVGVRNGCVVDTEEAPTQPVFPIFIDSRNFKGLLAVEDSRFVLIVDIIDSPEILTFVFGATRHEMEIAKEGKYVLFEVTKESVGVPYSISIIGQTFTGVCTVDN